MARIGKESTTVLVVEDNLMTARMIRSRLELEGIRVLEASNGLDALKILQHEKADLISADLMMPITDGFQLIREIRSLPGEQAKAPILIVSSNRNEQDMVRCLAAGADDYITKPISPQVYIERVLRLVKP